MKQDLLWERYMLLRFGTNWKAVTLTPSERGKINKGLKELKEIGATPETLTQKYHAYMRKHGKTCGEPSLQALLGNWNSLDGKQIYTREDSSETILAECKKRNIPTLGKSRNELLARLNS